MFSLSLPDSAYTFVFHRNTQPYPLSTDNLPICITISLSNGSMDLTSLKMLFLIFVTLVNFPYFVHPLYFGLGPNNIYHIMSSLSISLYISPTNCNLHQCSIIYNFISNFKPSPSSWLIVSNNK